MEDVPPSQSATDQMFDMVENLATQCQRMATSADEQFQLHDKWQEGKQFARTHPVPAFFALLVLAMSIIPVMCFCAFAVCTTLAVLISFLFIEAFALTVGAIILLGVLSFAAFLALGSSLLFGAALSAVAVSRSVVHTLRPPAGKHAD